MMGWINDDGDFNEETFGADVMTLPPRCLNRKFAPPWVDELLCFFNWQISIWLSWRVSLAWPRPSPRSPSGPVLPRWWRCGGRNTATKSEKTESWRWCWWRLCHDVVQVPGCLPTGRDWRDDGVGDAGGQLQVLPEDLQQVKHVCQLDVGHRWNNLNLSAPARVLSVPIFKATLR